MSSAGIREGIAPKVNPARAHTFAMPSVEARPPVPPDKLRLGLILPTWTTTDLSWAEVLEVAQTAADVGFDALYVSDHLLIPSNNAELKRRAGVDFPDDPDVELEGYLECFTVLAALAVAIPRLQLGSFVASAGYRNPGLLAKMAVTIDDVSGGRLVLGLGAGDSEGEHGTFGFPDGTPQAGPPREMAEPLRGHARLGIAEVQVALTMGGPEGVRAFAPVIEELRSGR